MKHLEISSITNRESLYHIIIDDIFHGYDIGELHDFYDGIILNEEELNDLIFYAPMALERKLELISMLNVPNTAYIKEIKNELSYIKTRLKDKIRLYECRYDDECPYKSKMIEEYSDLNSCLDYSKNYKSNDVWFEIRIKGGKHNYVVLDGKIVYCTHRHHCDLNIKYPFSPGDLISIDCSPFAPKKPAMVVWNTDRIRPYDCCGIGVLYKVGNEYSVSSLKHCYCFGNCYHPIQSPVYKTNYLKEELTEEYSFFKEIHEEIKSLPKDEIEDYVNKKLKERGW